MSCLGTFYFFAAKIFKSTNKTRLFQKTFLLITNKTVQLSGDSQCQGRFGRHFRLSRQPNRRGHDRHRHPPVLEDSFKPQPRASHFLQGPDGLHW